MRFFRLALLQLSNRSLRAFLPNLERDVPAFLKPWLDFYLSRLTAAVSADGVRRCEFQMRHEVAL